jgi:hypothetical protein
MYVLEVEEKNNTTFANEPGLIFSLALLFFYSLSLVYPPVDISDGRKLVDDGCGVSCSM